MAKITFGQITLEDQNLNIQQLIEMYKGLFKEDEFILPLISNNQDEEDIELVEEDDVEEETEVEPTQPTQTPVQSTQEVPQN